MKKALSTLLLISVATLGCAAFPAKRTPKLDKPRRAAELRETPAIRLVVNDETHRQQKNAKALERVLEKFPYLAPGDKNTLDPDYTIELNVDHHLTENGINEFAYYTILVVPAIFKDEVTVRAKVTRADGSLLGTVSSTGGLKTVSQMHLFWVLPVAAPLSAHSNSKMWRRSFRDALIQASRLIAGDQEDTALTAARAPSS